MIYIESQYIIDKAPPEPRSELGVLLMYRLTALFYAHMLLRKYRAQKREIRQMEKVFSRMERIWNIKIDTENFRVIDESLDGPKPAQSPA